MTQAVPVSPLRIGLLVDKMALSKYEYAFAKWALDRPNLAITHLILHPYSSHYSNKRGKSLNAPGSLSGLRLAYTVTALPTKIIFRIIDYIERLLLNRNERHKDHLKEFDISQIVPKLIPNKMVLTPTVSQSGYVHSFAASEIDKIRALNLDLLVSCAGVIVRGGILTAAKLGVISCRDADNGMSSCLAPGFWEVYLRQDTTGFKIQKLAEELSDAEVLLKGRVQTQYYYLLNQASIYETSNHYLKVVIDRIALDNKLPPALATFPYSGEPLRPLGAVVAVLYLAKLLAQVAKTNLQKCLGLQLRWNVAFVRSGWQTAALWRGFRIKNHAFHFLADPFVVAKNGKEFCFVEDFDYRTEKGTIAVYALEERDGRYLGTALEEPFHLSFPFIFDYQDELYMCPESAANKDIRIYRCLEFPMRWKFEKIVMKNVAAVDSMLFEMNGRWWLFTNIDPAGIGEHLELSIFHAESPLADYWTPHAQNPILLDSARNAGLVRAGHRYFRISQSRGFNLYGKKALINEIRELTESRYLETAVSEVAPNFEPGIVGVHHLDSKGKITVFDYLNFSRIHK